MATEKKAAVEEKPVKVQIEPSVQHVKDQEVKIGEQVHEEKDGKSEDAKQPVVEVKIKNISIKLPEDIHRKLKSKCAMDGMSTGSVMKRLIDAYVKG
jgi:hypothetical protein